MGSLTMPKAQAEAMAQALGFGSDLVAFREWHASAAAFRAPPDDMSRADVLDWALGGTAAERGPRSTGKRSPPTARKAAATTEAPDEKSHGSTAAGGSSGAGVGVGVGVGVGERVSVLSLNADDGGGGSARRVADIVGWLKDAAT